MNRSELEIKRENLKEVRNKLVCVRYEMKYNSEGTAFWDAHDELIEEQFNAAEGIAETKKREGKKLRDFNQEGKAVLAVSYLWRELGGTCEEGIGVGLELVDTVVKVQVNMGVRE